MTNALRKVRRRVEAVKEELEQLPQNEPEKRREGKRKAPRARVEEVEAEDEEEGQKEGQVEQEREEEEQEEEEVPVQKKMKEKEEQEEDEELSNERELKKQKGENVAKGRLIADGVAGRTADGLLVYFSLNEEVVAQRGKHVVCPSLDNEGNSCGDPSRAVACRVRELVWRRAAVVPGSARE